MKFLRCADGTQVNAAAIEMLYADNLRVLCTLTAKSTCIEIVDCETPEIAQEVIDAIVHDFTYGDKGHVNAATVGYWGRKEPESEETE